MIRRAVNSPVRALSIRPKIRRDLFEVSLAVGGSGVLLSTSVSGTTRIRIAVAITRRNRKRLNAGVARRLERGVVHRVAGTTKERDRRKKQKGELIRFHASTICKWNTSWRLTGFDAIARKAAPPSVAVVAQPRIFAPPIERCQSKNIGVSRDRLSNKGTPPAETKSQNSPCFLSGIRFANYLQHESSPTLPSRTRLPHNRSLF